MVIVQRIAGLSHIGFRELVPLGTGDLGEGFIFIGGAGDQCHIVNRRVMVLLPEAVHVVEMRARAAELLRALIHHLDEIFDAAADMLGNTVADLVRGHQHDRVQAVLHRQLLTGSDLDITRALSLDQLDSVPGECHLLLE